MSHVLEEHREQILTWFDSIPHAQAAPAAPASPGAPAPAEHEQPSEAESTPPEPARISIETWASVLQKLLVVGDYKMKQGSDIVGDERLGRELRCRLSLPQAKAAFVNSQLGANKDADAPMELTFDEILEAVARCGVCKYKRVIEMNAPEVTYSALTSPGSSPSRSFSLSPPCSYTCL